MCLLVVNPIPNKNLPHLIDIYPNIAPEFIVSSMKERSLLTTISSTTILSSNIDGGWTAHLLHPELIIDGYDVLYNRVGGEDSVGRDTAVIVRDVKDYLEKVLECPESVVDESNNPSIKWSCSMLGIKYSGRSEWDIGFSHPRTYNGINNIVLSILPYYYPRLFELVNHDPVQYLIISLINNDEDYWTMGLKNRELYLKRTPFETKVYLFMDDMAPKSFMNKFNHWHRAIKDYVPVDYLMDAVKIMLSVEKFLTNEVPEDALVNEYDCKEIKINKLYHDKTFNYI